MPRGDPAAAAKKKPRTDVKKEETENKSGGKLSPAEILAKVKAMATASTATVVEEGDE